MQNVIKKGKKNKSEKPPLIGLSVVATFLIWGGIAFYIPAYVDINNTIIFNIIGFTFLTISLGGSLIEISNIWKNEAYSYWGVSLVFLLPAILLHLSINYYEIIGFWSGVIKIAVIILLIIGTPFIPMGLSYLLWKRKDKNIGEREISEEERVKNSTNKIQLITSLIIAILTLTTAIVQLVSQVNK